MILPFSPIARYRSRLRRRERCRYLITVDLALQRELATNLRLAEEALRLTKDDEAMYERLVRRPMPVALRDAITHECHLWWSVRDRLHSMTTRDIPPALFKEEITSLTQRLDALETILRLTRTLVSRPLTHSEERELDTLLERWR